MSERFTQPVAIVTGAASGIGLASARELVGRGYAVVVADLDETNGNAVAAELSEAGTAIFVHADMTSATDVAALIERVREWAGRLDAVVNNAGIQRSGPITQFDEGTWDQLMGVNPKTCFLAAKYGVPLLAEGGGGAIVNISSIAGVRGGPGQVAYSASKGAIVAFSRALANELADEGIRVNCLAPGWVDTPFNAPAIENMGGREVLDEMVASSVPMKRQGTPQEIAKAVAFLATDDSSYMTGQTVIIDGGLL
ncbi:SDR family oxidoreductase [Aeromicrobium tamlense]|uniref:Dihydroanticapsin dehydrogenase n=1 Tax=Aeromicrobium tamlense TaxID=375541 RepID=A0A8I0FYF8_9ACTN|nr:MULTISPECIES: SDR family NAD(P)-dependent oxidoreductase [Aeromicrobium]MBD1272008.1 SDR family oxidoreductase [Aeromicrobium tamlense]NYI38800.1 dihydroanticapsin dehydrogenase [Aeromicrobium tamlense]